MLYLVGGCSRSGKSKLAERMRVRHGIPWFPLDGLKMGLHLGDPAFGVHPEEDDLETADLMWPITAGLLDHLSFDGRDYLVEGVNMRPRAVAQFVAESDEPVRACFLGYPDADIDAKAFEVANYHGLPNDWLNRTGPDNVRRYLETSRILSRDLRDECCSFNIAFIDTGTDFQAALEAAEQALISRAT
jgi:hypothetical protein